MDVGVYTYPLSDQLLIDKIVNEFLSQGKFDKLRKECMSDADTKPAYQNLQQRVENTVSQFLQKQVWKPDLNKNQLRDSLRKHILESGFFDAGINRIVDQVVNPNVLATVFMPEVEEVVYNYLSIPRPTDKNSKSGISNTEAKLIKCQSTSNEIGENESNSTGEVKKEGKSSNQSCDQESEKYSYEDLPYKSQIKHSNLSIVSSSHKAEATAENEKFGSDPIIKLDSKEVIYDKNEKMELTSDESQESFSKMTGKTYQRNVLELNPDSDDSAPLESNEKPLSDGENSDDSIMNQMSPISQGRLTPDILEEKALEADKAAEKDIISRDESIRMNKAINENLILEYCEKRPSQFVGKIPRINRKVSELLKSSKTNKTKNDKSEAKNFGSSDESETFKNLGKNDSEEKKPKENHKLEVTILREDRKHKENSGKNKNFEQNYKSSKSDYKESHVCEKFKDRKEKKKIKNVEKHENKKCLRDVSSNQHKDRHKDPKTKECDKKKKEMDKKKNKSTDDHSKERNKKEDRRSTDRDSNEREKDKSSNTRNHAENKNKEREQKVSENRKEKQKEGSKVEEEMETVPESVGLMIEMDSDWAASEDIVFIPEDMVLAEVAPEMSFPHLNYNDLYERGALTKINFPKLMDDFYVKFNSTGFKYFEEWEKTKMDCEEEFKEFVDEANNNLELISDEESDCEIGKNFNFEEKNRTTITNLLKGLGNFRKAAMFDLKTSEFYRWSSLKFYRKFRRKCEERERKSAEKESDDSTKENIIQSKGGKVCLRKDQALHLKLLNKYKKRAMTQVKRKRKLKKRKDLMTYVKENANNSSFLNVSVKKPFNTLAEEKTCNSSNEGSGGVGLNRINSDIVNSYGTNNSLNFTESKLKILNKIGCDAKSFISEEISGSTITQNLSLTLSLSPGRFETNAEKSRNFCKKKILRIEEDEIITTKKSKRNYSQKYDSQDLYKPRPVLNSTRSRGREKDAFSID